MPVEQQQDRLLTPFVGFVAGVDLSRDPVVLDPGVASDASNFVFLDGHIKLREGVKNFDDFTTGVASGSRGSIWSAVDEILFEDGTRYLLCANASKIFRYDGSAWTDVTGLALSTGSNDDPWNSAFGIDAGLGGTGTYFITNGTNDVLLFNPTADATAFHSIRTPPTGTYTGGPSNKLGARYALVFGGRLVLGYTVENTGAADSYHTTRTRISKVNDFLNWDTTDGALTVDHADTPGHITGLAEHRGLLYVLKRDSILVGQETGRSDTPIVFPVSFNVGCLEGRTFRPVRPDTAIFLGEDNVYLLRSGDPEPIGDPIRKDLLSRLNFDALRLAHARVDTTNSIYRLFIPVEDTTNVTRCYAYNWQLGVWGVEDYPTGVYAGTNSQVRGVVTIGDLTNTIGSYSDVTIGDWGQTTGPPLNVFSTKYSDTDYRLSEYSAILGDTIQNGPEAVTALWESGDVELVPGHVTTVRQVRILYDATGTLAANVGISTDRGTTWTTTAVSMASGNGKFLTVNFAGVSGTLHRIRIQVQGDANGSATVTLRAVSIAHTPGREQR